jgi:hypothetical protein
MAGGVLVAPTQGCNLGGGDFGLVRLRLTIDLSRRPVRPGPPELLSGPSSRPERRRTRPQATPSPRARATGAFDARPALAEQDAVTKADSELGTRASGDESPAGFVSPTGIVPHAKSSVAMCPRTARTARNRPRPPRLISRNACGEVDRKRLKCSFATDLRRGTRGGRRSGRRAAEAPPYAAGVQSLRPRAQARRTRWGRLGRMGVAGTAGRGILQRPSGPTAAGEIGSGGRGDRAGPRGADASVGG